MQSKHYVLLGSGMAVAVAAGVGIAMMQSKPPAPVEPSPTVTAASPSSPVRVTPTPDPLRPKPTAAPNSTSVPPAAPPAATTAPPSEPAAPARPVLARESCVLTMAIVSDPNPPLNVRSSPSTSGQVVGQLKNGTYVTVVNQKDGWLQISVPEQGWISQSQTERGCNQLTARIQFPTGADSAQIADRFVGTGSHRYLLNASQGQTISLTRQDGVLPTVLTPDGKPLTPPALDNLTSWKGKLPASGEYTLLLDSNYKGYDYAFQVRVN